MSGQYFFYFLQFMFLIKSGDNLLDIMNERRQKQAAIVWRHLPILPTLFPPSVLTFNLTYAAFAKYENFLDILRPMPWTKPSGQFDSKTDCSNLMFDVQEEDFVVRKYETSTATRTLILPTYSYILY